jgi:hypothetical protein
MNEFVIVISVFLIGCTLRFLSIEYNIFVAYWEDRISDLWYDGYHNVLDYIRELFDTKRA